MEIELYIVRDLRMTGHAAGDIVAFCTTRQIAEGIIQNPPYLPGNFVISVVPTDRFFRHGFPLSS